MALDQTPVDRLWVAIDRPRAFVRVQNRGSFKISSAFKQFGHAAIENGCSEIVLDMADCVGMDSTFMGVLAGLSVRLRKQNGGEIVLINLSHKTRGLLSTLGLDQIVHPYMAGAETEAVEGARAIRDRLAMLDAPRETKQETAETMLEAHENLVNLSAENLPKFKDVLTFLREDVKQARRDASS